MKLETEPKISTLLQYDFLCLLWSFFLSLSLFYRSWRYQSRFNLFYSNPFQMLIMLVCFSFWFLAQCHICRTKAEQLLPWKNCDEILFVLFSFSFTGSTCFHFRNEIFCFSIFFHSNQKITCLYWIFHSSVCFMSENTLKLKKLDSQRSPAGSSYGESLKSTKTLRREHRLWRIILRFPQETFSISKSESFISSEKWNRSRICVCSVNNFLVALKITVIISIKILLQTNMTFCVFASVYKKMCDELFQWKLCGRFKVVQNIVKPFKCVFSEQPEKIKNCLNVVSKVLPLEMIE